MPIPAKIQSMKKGIPKGDKKKRKEVTADIARLEQELQERHKEELESIHTVSSEEVGELEAGMGGVTAGEERVGGGEKKTVEEEKPSKKSRAQKRRVCGYFLHTYTLTTVNPHQEKKALQDLENQQRREEEEKEMALVGNPRLKEREKLESLLEPLHLTVIDIQPDGNW